MAGKMTIYKLVVLGDGGVGKVSYPLAKEFSSFLCSFKFLLIDLCFEMFRLLFHLQTIANMVMIDRFDNSGISLILTCFDFANFKLSYV
jgi:hypothetical protein